MVQEIEELYKSQAERLMVSLTATGRLRHHNAQEVLHDAFAALQQRMEDETRPPVDNPRLYLWRTATYISRRRRRRDGQRPDREHRAGGYEPRHAPDGTAEVEAHLDLMRLAPELAGLSERQLTAYWYHHAEGFTVREVADLMGISAKSVTTYLKRADVKVAECTEGSKGHELR